MKSSAIEAAKEVHSGKKAAIKAAAGKKKPANDDNQVEAFKPTETGEGDINAATRNHLRSFIERLERLNEEKQTVSDDIKDVFGEAKAMGFDKKALREILKIRKQDGDERAEFEAVLSTYLIALGMQRAG